MSSENDRTGSGAAAPGDVAGEQLALIRDTVRKAKEPRARPRTWRGAKLADPLPVARVLVDKGLLHLDQYFDYAVPEAMDADAQPGVRVRVRFGARVVRGRREGGELHDGFVVDRLTHSDYSGPLAPLAQVLSPEPVLGPDLLRLCRAVADRYAGALADVVQLAVPPRRVRPEGRPSADPLPPPAAPPPGSWTRYRDGTGYLDALAAGAAPRAVWTALPGPHWPRELATALAAALAGGRGALAVLPDRRSVARVDEALTDLLGAGRHVVLTADSGPEERYRSWLAVNRGAVRAVVGTRAAMFAPVRGLGLAALWDDGDSSHAEPHAPQPHARDVLLLRAADEGAAFLLGGPSVTVEGAQLVDSRWASPLAADRDQVRRAAPLVRTVGDADQARDSAARTARLPTLAWGVTRDALRHGPVLVQVPRRGYVPRLACERCREAARCGRCAGPLELGESGPAAGGTLHCGWCGRPEAGWHCAACGATRLRAQVVGARRTADELGRAFPGVPVRTSGRDAVLDRVPGEPALVIATPGAEPVAAGGYAAALLLDGWALLGRPDLRAGEEALRRWLVAASLVRPASGNGTVVVVAEPTLRPVQALVRWDPAGHAVRELAERAELGFPPVSRMASVTGTPAAVADLLRTVELPDGADVLGPVPLPVAPPGSPRRTGEPPPGERWDRVLLRVRPGTGGALAAALKTAQIARIARKAADPVRVRVDPPDIG
ncbi:primosomal protein N' [Streptomyces sp. SL13]|uniref:Probable replication restart protein PriA n=1 Tax=Streptantibioticus silvisoli TaxID=2705255 RepID=A0AA90H7Y1_9ACTN|nr:primosomal protein N' [Streptantibioticus silvisoli]MDI5964710.1 primosomal protein N' [Streptantibioticus silvisoli]MDI5972184.1 primosomal protein N' [Streptantibioticus silvisoli]